MHRIYAAFIEMLAASVFVIPIFSIYGKCRIHNLKRTLLYMIFGFYLVAVLFLVGFPSLAFIRFDFSINVIPFVNMPADVRNTCLNVLMFVPLGIFLPVLWDEYRNIKSTMLVAFCMTVGIEISQFFSFRATDIDDIITNMTGALIGYLVAKGITRNFKRHLKSNENNKDLYLICGTIAVIIFFLQPFVSSLLWEIVL